MTRESEVQSPLTKKQATASHDSWRSQPGHGFDLPKGFKNCLIIDQVFREGRASGEDSNERKLSRCRFYNLRHLRPEQITIIKYVIENSFKKEIQFYLRTSRIIWPTS
ncbi:conserved hypothetical protein [Ricinus communis]|uniref:Uncharacterized protein n=1 Tax=Ricinus communis TaxID=3988 RepID=B9R6X5_RICCO|nr:conserved hypothetical protein [Ricinus communis]